MPHLHRRACNLCEAICGLQVEVDAGRIVSIKGDPDDPHSRGFICPKALALKDLQEDPDRIRQPMRRTPDGWEPVGWDEALDEAGRAIAAIQKRHGMDALGIYWGNPPTHNHGLVLTMNPVFDALRTRNRYSAASVDQLPQYLVSRLMFGNQLMFPVPDLDHTQFWLILGGNPLASNGSVGSGPDMRSRLKAIQARGGAVVVVDPRRTETAQLASQHLAIRPGGDVWLLLALLQVITSEQLAHPARVLEWSRGLDQVAALVATCTPESVVDATGLDAESIRQLARDFAAAPSAVAYGRLGVCQTPNATLSHWLINLLNLLTGNTDRVGGAMFTTPAFDITGLAKLFAGGGHYARWKSRVRGLPEFSDELPAATLADEMLTPGVGQIKAMLLVAGNPVLSTPNGARLDTAMQQLDYCVAVDFYINESTRHANLILPPVTTWERGNFEAAVNAVQVRNVARYSQAALDAPADSRQDWQILTGLLARVEQHRDAMGWLVGRLRHGVSRVLTPDRLLDIALRLGPHGAWRRAGARLSLGKLRSAQRNLDLGPLQPSLPQALYTADKKVDAVPALMREELVRLLATRGAQTDAAAGLVLIGRRHVRTNNSWMHNYTRLVKGPSGCTLLMHPVDADQRQVFHGDMVSLRSRTGAITVELAVSEDMRPGVVSLPHGWGHDKPGTRLRVARDYAGASVNDVTDELLVDRLSGNAAVNGVVVDVLPMP
ncbi:molybdopterin-dependent oxidoreductase [Rhodoferax saidenbachensis]|uniref:4Fe-4S Mo/W bis-MGD-type domain-containing protein n=1 Tax=Rhodoferax saidenbachensis TaxID=1484693 RepID=A0A1P8KE50_9BURK|nr:molybdopterin-dependent oxidoreductase [Rhodoferax saidenbachensis]APW44310.1 hypothetical protein RS694_18460 [Rhodoferax saidenbachensis]